ncbi:MAG TPA: carboxypeptidase regulatory-like domain-containing protein [Terriglobales bacterium]|nr:carboxypeptidase regulatory-like domain-containing protein [Terriglobales bacterium]
MALLFLLYRTQFRSSPEGKMQKTSHDVRFSKKINCAFAYQLLAIFFFSLIFAPLAQAQVDRAGLNGTVTDPAGRMLPKVHVTALLHSTGLRREAISFPNGSYDIPELPVGVYTITFDHEGFEPLSVSNVIQAVGETRTLNVMLKVAGTSEQVDVSGSAVELDQTANSLGARIERKQIEALPLNGRNWATLTALVPGAIDAGGSNQRTIRFAGRGLDDNNFTSDGIDATNIVNQAQQPFVRLAIPTDTIQEFRIESMLFTAESGSTPGGQIAVATASGSNQLHGDAFEFLRNGVFDARNPFDRSLKKPPFRLHQFGASVGGPLVRDKTFFYASYEGIRQTLGQTLTGFVPTDAFRAQVVAQSPALASIINAYPEGQTQISQRIAQFSGTGEQLDRENSGMIRLDQHFTDKSTAFLRFNMDAAVSSVPLGTLNDRQDTNSRPVNAVMEFLHIFSPTLVNEAKAGFNRGTVVATNLNHNGLPFSVSVPGFTTQNNNQDRIGVGNSFSWIDNLTWVHGRHIIKAGIEVRRIQLQQGNTASGSIAFSKTPDLNALDAFAANQVNAASFAAALPVNGLRKTEFYGFIEDEYRLKPNFTVNLGVRYSFFNRFHEVQDRAIPFDFATCGPQGFCGAGAEFSRPNLADVDPRVAFAWAPHALGGKTVLRSGFGIYHGDGQLDDQNLPISNEVQRFSLSQRTIPNLDFPLDPFLANTAGIVSPRDMDRRRKDMYVTQWGASVQQVLPQELVATVSYIGSKGTHLLTTSFINTINPATATRQFPGFGQVEFRGNENNSSFEALQTSLQRSFKHGLLFSLNYLWSHEIDDGSLGGGDSDFPQNPECRACERASGDFDARHTFNANLVYELPFGSGRTYLNQPGILRALLGSWNLTSILAGRTGLPVNVTLSRSGAAVPDGNTQNQRPNLVPGVSLIPPTGQSETEWINPAAFSIPASGTFGNAPRNLLRGPALWQTDVGLARHFVLSERIGLEFRAEAFNLFNRAQLAAPQSDFSVVTTAGPGTVQPNVPGIVQSNGFGAILSTVNKGPVGTGTPRQLQFMLRMNF